MLHLLYTLLNFIILILMYFLFNSFLSSLVKILIPKNSFSSLFISYLLPYVGNFYPSFAGLCEKLICDCLQLTGVFFFRNFALWYFFAFA